MIDLVCERCGAAFQVKPYRVKSAHFCSRSCSGKVTGPRNLPNDRRHTWSIGNQHRKGLPPAKPFPKGHRPWNKDRKGIHLSPSSEFKPGITPANKLPIGSETVRTDKNGKPRAWVKVAEPNYWKPRAQVTWERANGAIPDGFIVHHRNRDTTDDALANLELISRAEHINEHRAELKCSSA